MDNDDHRELLTVIQSGLRDLGLDEIADPTAYRDVEGVAYRPADLVLKMLYALQRYLPLEDRRTFEEAMAALEETTGSRDIPDPVVELTADQALLSGNPDHRQWSFKDLPNLEDARATLDNLIRELSEDQRGEQI